MPNRLVRDGILTSERVNSLSGAAELFYRRLMSVVDDYGRFDGRPHLLRVSCYPLRVDKVREADISRWLAECQAAGLIALYAVNGKPYVEMQDFRQQVRAKASKWPDPPVDDGCTADAKHVHSTCDASAHLDVVVGGDVKPASQGAAAPAEAGEEPPEAPDPLFGSGLAFLMRKGIKERSARSFLGLLRKELRDDLVCAELVIEAERQDVSDPMAWLRGAAEHRKKRAPAGSPPPAAGLSPPAVETPETKWRDARAWAKQQVDFGQWDQSQADAYLSEQRQKLGVAA